MEPAQDDPASLERPCETSIAVRFFNTEGPIIPEDHYFIPPLDRVDMDEVLTLIRRKKYFVLHAPRQTGKTSTLLALADRLNRGGEYRCLYMNVEAGQAMREDVGSAVATVLSEMVSRASEVLHDDSVYEIWSGIPEQTGPGSILKEVLVRWCSADSRPLVLLIDEIDALIGDSLVSVLRQLRSGYDWRPVRFPQSVVLCGVRDVCACRVHTASGGIVPGGSAFNVKAKSLRLGDFTEGEVRALVGQHAEETGQAITEEALAGIWEQTCGQPWLVNALGYQACFEDRAARDRSRPITLESVLEARESLILRCDTHLDQLVHKLREPRVRRVIEPLLSGGRTAVRDDDIAYVRDLGLVTRQSPLAIANPIYREVIPRELTSDVQDTITNEPESYVGDDGRLLVSKLLAAFQEYFRENSEHWVERFGYKEAGPQLLLQAFLQRIVNSGGRVEREYGLGRLRTDLLVTWPTGGEGAAPGGRQKVVIECKLLRGSLEQTLGKGVSQTLAYMDRAAAKEGHLVIFDRSTDASWEQKVFRREEEGNGKPVTEWGM